MFLISEKIWTYIKHGPGSMDHLMDTKYGPGSMDPVHGPPHPTPWTTPNFQKEIAPVNMKIYRRSGYEKHILIFIAYVLEGLSRNSGLLWIKGTVVNLACEQAHIWEHTHEQQRANSQKGGDPVGRSLVRRCKERFSLSLHLVTRLLPAGSPPFWIRSLPLASMLPNVSLLAGYSELCYLPPARSCFV